MSFINSAASNFGGYQFASHLVKALTSYCVFRLVPISDHHFGSGLFEYMEETQQKICEK